MEPTDLASQESFARHIVPSVLLLLLPQVATVSTLDSRIHTRRTSNLGRSTEDRLTGYLEERSRGARLAFSGAEMNWLNYGGAVAKADWLALSASPRGTESAL